MSDERGGTNILIVLVVLFLLWEWFKSNTNVQLPFLTNQVPDGGVNLPASTIQDQNSGLTVPAGSPPPWTSPCSPSLVMAPTANPIQGIGLQEHSPTAVGGIGARRVTFSTTGPVYSGGSFGG